MTEVFTDAFTAALTRQQRILVRLLVNYGGCTTPQLQELLPARTLVAVNDTSREHIRVQVSRARRELERHGWTITKCRGGKRWRDKEFVYRVEKTEPQGEA